MFASVNGIRCYSLTLTMPPRGLWVADAQTTEELQPTTGAATITVAGLTLVGFIIRAGNFLDDATSRIVAGYGGWSQTIRARSYQNPFGLKLRPILTDAANESGERINVVTDGDAGNFYVRQFAVAARVLNQLCPQWWVAPDGVTQIGPRPTPVVSSQFDVIAEGTDLGRGRVQIATDKPEDWTPGVLFTAPTIPQQMQASTIVHRLTKDSLRTEVWTSP